MSQTVSLEVWGGYEVGYSTNHRGAKHVGAENGREFMERHHDVAWRRGCYLFAIRNRGLTPIYVGKATKGFGREVFTADKLTKYNRALHQWDHGKPLLYFVVTPERIRSSKLISEVEIYLIQSARQMNDELLNVHHNKDHDWEIKGVTARHRGHRTDPEEDFCRMTDHG